MTDCWLYAQTLNNRGYGRFYYQGKRVFAHRAMYEFMVAPIPQGMVIDHICRVRQCINPEHLEVVTQRENTLRGEGISALNAKKTHCKRGHEFTADNMYRQGVKRACKTCVKANRRAWHLAHGY